MEADYKTRFYMIGKLKIMLCGRWQGFEYVNRTGAAGWSFKFGFVHFYGDKR